METEELLEQSFVLWQIHSLAHRAFTLSPASAQTDCSPGLLLPASPSPGSLATSYKLPESTVPLRLSGSICLLLTFIFWLLFSHLQLTFIDGFCIFLPHSCDTYLFLFFFPVMLGKMFLLLPEVYLYSWALCPISSRLLTASDFYLLNSSCFFHISSLTACLNLSHHNLKISWLP